MSKSLFQAVVSGLSCERGAVRFDAKFAGMRKAQEFIVYPHRAGATSIVVQSDTRIGEITLDSGKCRVSSSYPGGAFFGHLAMVETNNVLDSETLEQLKKQLTEKASNDGRVCLSSLI